MADITPVAPAFAGVNPAPTAANSGGDALVNPRGNAILVVANGGGGSINVTIAVGSGFTTRPADGTFPSQTVSNLVVAVPAGATRVIGPIPPAYNDGNGKAQISYSGVTSVTVWGLQP
ncbi:MAG: hypothetical protein ACK4WH_01055 [Phycisphaerales bacterium]